LHERAEKLSRGIACETGKPPVEALGTEIMVVLDATRFLIRNAFRCLREEPLPHGSPAMWLKAARIVREPYGVIGIISPWNYPFSIPATQALAALVAGNAVVLKPSEYSTIVALGLSDLVRDAGLPEQLLQVVPGDRVTGAILVDSAIDKLVFTGSVQSGKGIAQCAAERLLPVVLELGGKDAMLVLDDADVDFASSGAVWGAFVNAGQTCLSIERCYVAQRIYKDFVEACVEKTRRLKVGNGLEQDVDVGPMIHAQQMAIVQAHVRDAEERGAHIRIGGRCLPELGPNFYFPTVLSEVNHTMRIMREETFGPVLPIMSFANDNEAVRLANDSEYGLAASIWTRDRTRGEVLSRRLEAGMVMVNDAVSCFGISEAPHGGYKSSGIGRTHGPWGLEEMVRVKYIDSDRLTRFKKPWWYGYGQSMQRQMKGWMDLQFARRNHARLLGGARAISAMLRGDKGVEK
jgi:succinate-semialdehyde dehydrogenase/glutarate-semialdehyde dehydrogenase